MARKNEDEPKTDTNQWMTTYTDLTTLLLTFFVLLLSIATIDEQNRRIALNSLVGAFGFKPGAQSIIGSPEGANITLGTAPMKPEEISYEKLQNVVLRNTLEKDVTVVMESDRVILTLGHQVLFRNGSSRILPKGRVFLEELAPVLKDGRPRLIELRGFAAHPEIVFEADPDRTAMLLSTRRAVTVFRYLSQEAGISGHELVAHGFGRDPGVNRKSRDRGRLDRQVQIILDFSEEVPYRLKHPSEEESILDFKGFLFRFPGDAGG